MFLRKLQVEYVRASVTEGASDAANESAAPPRPCPLHWIDNFAMRNFTNSAVFDDTLPLGDGRMEAGLRVPLDALEQAMKEWFRRKGYLREGDRLMVRELERKQGGTK